jgi:cyclase
MRLRSFTPLYSAFCILHSAFVSAQQQPQLKMTIETIAPRLHVISGFTNGNILVIEAPTELVLVDAQSDRRVGLADSALRTVTKKSIRQVIFTHYHDDHTLGMPYWRKAGAAAVAHASVLLQMAKDTTITSWDNWHRTKAPAAARPDLTFQDSLALDLGGQRVWLYHVPPAHTDGDVIVVLPWANVIHTGDLIEPGGPPFIDWWVGGSLDGMIAATDRILMLANESTRIVPGHGPVINKSIVIEHRRMLVALRERIGNAVRDGKTLDQVQAEAPAKDFEQLLGGPSGASRFVRLLYYGLSSQ